MDQRSSRLRTGWAALAVGALVASLLAVGAATATATTDTPDERSSVSVCVGEALEDRNFTDVPRNHIFHDAINCLAHFGITIGSGDGSTFTPNEPVNRWQMMLFLTRALGPANINLNPARAQNFTDVRNLNAEARDAIDLLVTNGIAVPASGRTFDPYAIVDRAEMAQLLVNFLDAAGSVVSFDTAGNILLDANGDGSQSIPDDYFKDARDLVPVAADLAISAAYELGITTGADPTPAAGAAQPGLDYYYRPFGSVTRGQMAAFIIRTLAHTQARPKGLSAQYDGDEIRVSVRDGDFEPVDAAPIDMFFVDSEDANRTFNSSGRCSDVVEFVDGTYVCEIDSNDPITNNDGEVSLTVPDTILAGIDTTVWVWTGRYGDEVDQHTDLLRLEVAPSQQVQGAAQARISTSFRGSKAKFGTTVSFSVQLQDDFGNDVRTGVDGDRPAEFELVEELLAESGTPDGVADKTDQLLSKTPRTVRSDSSGRITFSLSVSDPDRGSTGQTRTRTYTLVPGTNAPTVFAGDDPELQDGAHFLVFSDVPSDPAAAVVELTTTSDYINAPSSGSVHSGAVVSVFDEYGQALSAATASLAGGADSTITTQSFKVGSDGIHRFSYSYSGGGGEVETLTVTVDPDGNDATSNNKQATAYMYWPVLTLDVDSQRSYPILFGDTDRNEIIVDPANAGADNPSAAEPERVLYDSNDRFDVQGPNDSEPRPVASMEEFEKALAGLLTQTPTGACLEWTNFVRSRYVAEFRLWSTCK